MGWFKNLSVCILPFHGKGMTLIKFDRRGCMATDWQEEDRGVVIGREMRSVYNGSKGGAEVEMLIVRRDDGTWFDVFRDYVHDGKAEMQRQTDNPEESLVGKLVAI